MYGNRAANGVVLITTKHAKSSKPTVTLNINQGIYQRGIPEYERLGANQWMEASWKAMKNYVMDVAGYSCLNNFGTWSYVRDRDFLSNIRFDKLPIIF